MPRPRGTGTEREWVYLVQSGEAVKIGRTKNLDQRIASLQTGSPHPIVVLRAFPTQVRRAGQLETALLERMAHRLRGEWVCWQPGIDRIADGIAARFVR